MLPHVLLPPAPRPHPAPAARGQSAQSAVNIPQAGRATLPRDAAHKQLPPGSKPTTRASTISRASRSQASCSSHPFHRDPPPAPTCTQSPTPPHGYTCSCASASPKPSTPSAPASLLNTGSHKRTLTSWKRRARCSSMRWWRWGMCKMSCRCFWRGSAMMCGRCARGAGRRMRRSRGRCWMCWSGGRSASRLRLCGRMDGQLSRQDPSELLEAVRTYPFRCGQCPLRSSVRCFCVLVSASAAELPHSSPLPGC